MKRKQSPTTWINRLIVEAPAQGRSWLEKTSRLDGRYHSGANHCNAPARIVPSARGRWGVHGESREIAHGNGQTSTAPGGNGTPTKGRWGWGQAVRSRRRIRYRSGSSPPVLARSSSSDHGYRHCP